MSASNPNSWEPYGSSQQSPALGWRTPATRPAQTLSERWRNAQANALQPPFPRPSPSTTPPNPVPKGKALDLAAFQRAEQEHRLVTRYESIRSEVREVAESVKLLTQSLENARQCGDVANNALREETAALHVTTAKLSERFHGCAYVTEQQVKDIIKDAVNGQTNVLQLTNKALERIEEKCKRISNGVDGLNAGFRQRVSKHVVDDVRDMMDRRVIPVVENRVEGVVAPVLERVEDVLGGYMDSVESRLDHMEDILTACCISSDRGPLQGGFDHGRGEVYEERFCREYNAHDTRDMDDQALSSERGGYGVGDDSAPKAREFDVSGRAGEKSRVSQDGSIVQGAIWARLRIRPPAKKVNVIDLTKSDDSAVETNLFEDSNCGEGVTVVKTEDVVARSGDRFPDEGFVTLDGRSSRYYTRSAKKRRFLEMDGC